MEWVRSVLSQIMRKGRTSGASGVGVRIWGDDARYKKQSRLIRSALRHEYHSLDLLLGEMEREGEGAIYLSGGRIDNDFCFGTKELGLAISKLPADAAKAAEPGYHPGSTEVYVVFKGSLVIDLADGAKVVEERASEGSVKIIDPGRCHRVRSEGDEAASLIVKTRLYEEPSVVRCGDCGISDSVDGCRLRKRWESEEEERRQVRRS